MTNFKALERHKNAYDYKKHEPINYKLTMLIIQRKIKGRTKHVANKILCQLDRSGYNSKSLALK